MCLYINGWYHKDFKPVILSEDLQVWKCLRRSNNTSPLMGFKYTPGETYDQELKAIERDDGFVVTEGFHAYLRSLDAEWSRCAFDRQYCADIHSVRAFTIPAGSYVFLGEEGDIVSNHIKMDPLP